MSLIAEKQTVRLNCIYAISSGLKSSLVSLFSSLIDKKSAERKKNKYVN